MPKLPVLSGKRLIKLLEKNGFYVVRQKGSHVFLESEDGDVSTVIPMHGNEDLGKGILKAILNETKLSVEDLIEMLKN